MIHAGRTTSRGTRSHRKSFGKNMTYTRPDALSPHSLMGSGAAKSTARPTAADTEDELKKLRFLRHATAFDVDIDALDDHPWRSKTVDLLDYFNYGFNERTWLVRILLTVCTCVFINELNVNCRFTVKSSCASEHRKDWVLTNPHLVLPLPRPF